jgi:hypothetical protein
VRGQDGARGVHDREDRHKHTLLPIYPVGREPTLLITLSSNSNSRSAIEGHRFESLQVLGQTLTDRKG